jgi:hypothetical protein
VVITKNAVFRDVMLSLMVRHPRRQYSSVLQKKTLIIFNDVTTSNLVKILCREVQNSKECFLNLSTFISHILFTLQLVQVHFMLGCIRTTNNFNINTDKFCVVWVTII